jgi:hypothetical protein
MVMSRSTRLRLLTAFVVFGLAASGRLLAADTAPTAPANTGTSVFTDPAKSTINADAPATTPRPARPRRDRAISGDLAAALSSTLPKYDPPKPVEKKPVDESVDLREVDKPKNGIVRLADYIVRETRPPVFRDRELATDKAALAMKRNAGLRVGNIFGSNDAIALQMYQEQERLDNMAELTDDARTARRAGDKAAADFISKQSQDTYMRRADFGQVYSLGPK